MTPRQPLVTMWFMRFHSLSGTRASAAISASIMIANNLDCHTLVADDAELGDPSLELKTFEWDDEGTGHHYRFTFVQNRLALVPRVLRRLWAERKAAKQKMKQAASEFERGVHDGTQLAIKLMMNAMYGFFGAKDIGKMPCLPIAMVITYVGRQSIMLTQKLVLCKYALFDDTPPPPGRADALVHDMMLANSLGDLEARKKGGVQNVYGDTDSVFIKWDVPPALQAEAQEARRALSEATAQAARLQAAHEAAGAVDRAGIERAQREAERAQQAAGARLGAAKRAILEYVFAQAEEAAAFVTAYLNAHHCPVRGVLELEFEKVYYTFLMLSKKRYAGLMWTRLERADKIDVKGMQVVRRDNPGFVKDTMKRSLDAILIEGDVEAAASIVRTTLDRRISREMGLDELQISKQLKSSYTGTEPAHAGAARRMRKRGLDVVDGDRVPYVFPVSSAGELQCDRAEDPEFVREHRLPIDWVFYVEHCFTRGVCELLFPVLPNLLDDVIAPRLRELNEEAIRAKIDAEKERERERGGAGQ